MEWLKITVSTTHAEIDTVCAKLTALGYDQLEIEDAAELADFIEKEKPFWQLVDDDLLANTATSVSFYIDGANAAALDLGGLEYTSALIRDEDWIDNWKQYYKPIRIGKRILIQPEWELLENTDDRAVFWCDPGVSFGTGTHATTRLCLEFLDRLVKDGDTVLDLGCGSGILSVTALLLGAASAAAYDIDKQACGIALRNAERNGKTLRAEAGNLLDDEQLWNAMEKADIVCANLVADLIIALAPRFKAVTGENLLVSGILSERAGEVCDVLKLEGFAVEERMDSEGWSAVWLKA